MRLIVDFENKVSSKRGFLRVSRGYLGNALKCVVGYSYALAEAEGLNPPDIVVETANREYTIVLKPDKVREVIESKIVAKKRRDDDSFSHIKIILHQRVILYSDSLIIELSSFLVLY
ncbi:MAG: hypothetical protein V1850_01980 [Candidatus Bathyarchaeota archaeon]